MISCPWWPIIDSRSPSTPKTARPSGEKPGIDRVAATRSTSVVESASASARPASSRNASRALRQSGGGCGPRPCPSPGSRTSCRVPLSSGPRGRSLARTVRSTVPSSPTTRSSDSATVPSAMASDTAPDSAT